MGYIVPLYLNVHSDNNTAQNERRFNLNANNEPNNVAPMVLDYIQVYGNNMKTWNNLYPKICAYKNLELAYKKARKGKTSRRYVVEFEENLKANLTMLKSELETFTYLPSPLTTFVIRDPKTRKISASHFRDRVIHHALCNIIAPIFEREFIHTSFANQKGKGTHLAIKTFEKFQKQSHYVNERNKISRERERHICKTSVNTP